MKPSRCAPLLLVFASLLPTAAPGQAANSGPDRNAPSKDTAAVDCQGIATQDDKLDLVAKLCELALGYQNQLPNFIVQQTTTFESGSSTTVMTAEVTFRQGLESYSRVTVNGRSAPVSRMTTRPPEEVQFSSTGEFGPALLDLFRIPGAVRFKFKTTSTLRNQPVAIYQFHVPQKQNLFWTVRPGDGRAIRPEFSGEVWLEQQTGRPLREEIEPVSLPVSAEIFTTRTVIDYAMTPVGDAGTFLLPSKSESTMCRQGVSETAHCMKNVMVFHGYRKFGADTRIVPETEQQ